MNYENCEFRVRIPINQFLPYIDREARMFLFRLEIHSFFFSIWNVSKQTYFMHYVIHGSNEITKERGNG